MTDNIQNSGQASDCTSKTVASNAGTVEEINGFEARPVSYKTFEEQLEKRLKPNTENSSIEEALRVSQEVTSLKDACTSTGAEAAVSFYLCPEVHELPLRPPRAIESNYVQYFVTDFLKPGHDQYIYRHANGLCVIGLASTHVAFGDKPQITAVDFNVGKSSRSDMKVSGKRKKNAHFLEAISALCKVVSNDTYYIVRCCVKGSLLEVNERLIKEPELLNTSGSSEGYVAIMMPKPEDWLKAKSSFLSREEYKKQRGLC